MDSPLLFVGLLNFFQFNLRKLKTGPIIDSGILVTNHLENLNLPSMKITLIIISTKYLDIGIVFGR